MLLIRPYLTWISRGEIAETHRLRTLINSVDQVHEPGAEALKLVLVPTHLATLTFAASVAGAERRAGAHDME